MPLDLLKLEVGPWPMNSYIVCCRETKECAVIDPGADAKKILNAVSGLNIKFILITHGHADHIGALKEVGEKTGALICAHPENAARFKIDTDLELSDGDELRIGTYLLRTIHTPGHTAGQVCFDLLDGRIMVGDTVFAGGPGKTWSAEDFETTMENMQKIVFKWSDDTRFYPGHGPAGIIGEEWPAYEDFAAKGWKKGLFGDVSWK
jgi:glyoxylase-like metal-dependent hydrolase (beta-lactamase superfamily II)